MAQGKSPFELRADLLKLAFKILLAEHGAKASANGTTHSGIIVADTAPSSEEIIEEARKLNDFISKSGSDRRDK